MKLRTAGSPLAVPALLVGCTDALSSLQAPRSNVRIQERKTFTVLSASSKDDQQLKKQSWFDRQIQKQQEENDNVDSMITGIEKISQNDDKKAWYDQQVQRQKLEIADNFPSQVSSSSSPSSSGENSSDRKWYEQPAQFQKYDGEIERQRQERGDWTGELESSDWYDQQEIEMAKDFSKDSFIAYIQSAFVGAVVGTVAVLPVTAYHYFTFADYLYTTYAQMEWDLIAAVIQGALFSTIYRYGLRDDVEDTTLQSRILWAFVIVKSLVRVEVPAECAAGHSYNDLPLYCAEPFYIASDSMVAELFINFAESFALFGATAAVMNVLLKGEWIRRYPK